MDPYSVAKRFTVCLSQENLKRTGHVLEEGRLPLSRKNTEIAQEGIRRGAH